LLAHGNGKAGERYPPDIWCIQINADIGVVPEVEAQILCEYYDWLPQQL
jgi:hypothetical protein